jgi:hypothetical protein
VNFENYLQKSNYYGLVAQFGVKFSDECMIRDYQAIFRTWFPKGKQRIVLTYEKHHGVKLVGVLNYENGEVFCIHAEKYDAEVFLDFLMKVVSKYCADKILLILDPHAAQRHQQRMKTRIPGNNFLAAGVERSIYLWCLEPEY